MKKLVRICNIFLIIALLFNLFIPISFGNTIPENNAKEKSNYVPKEEYWSTKNKPFFYGATKITVPVGTTIDLEHDARFRIFVKDMEDGDLTTKIKKTLDTIDTTKAGEYQVTYEVTDSHNNTSTIEVPVNVVEDTTEINIERTMYSLPSVDHLNNLGYTRGNNMDRQIVGLFLDLDGEFQMRHISGGDLIVKLQNDDQNTESEIKVQSKEKVIEVAQKKLNDEKTKRTESNPKETITDEELAKELKLTEELEGWVNIKNIVTTEGVSTNYISLPTIKTLYKQTEVVKYEIKYDTKNTNTKRLHYYHQGDGATYQETFLKEWAEDENSYSIIDGASYMISVPYIDHDRLFETKYPGGKPYESLDNYLDWWDQVMDHYDDLIGLSYDHPVDELSQNVKTKYFGKANKHGAGAAYYASGDHVGINQEHDWSFFQYGWGNLHEVGHGYQAQVGGNAGGLPIGEVGVNIFCYYIQTYTPELNKYNDNWLSLATRETEYNKARQDGKGFYDNGEGNVGAAGMLYAIVNMLNYFDDYKEAYAYINQYYRRVYSETGTRMKTTDVWALALAEKYNVNVVPYIESWGITVSDDVKDELMAKPLPTIYYMKEMLTDDTKGQELKTKLNNFGLYDLVSTNELKDTNLKGKVTFNINIANLDNIKNQTITINDGGNTIKTLTITDKTITTELPIGTYKVAFPKSKEALDYDNLYIIVKDSETNTYEVNYKPINNLDYGFKTSIRSRGYWGEDYTPFKIDLVGDNLIFNYADTYPNSGGDNKVLFSSLTVLDNENKEVYKKSVQRGWYDTWVKDKVTNKEIPVKEGYKLKIYYAGNKEDVRVTNGLTGKITKLSNEDFKNHEITFVVTEYGLVPESLANDQDKLYQKYSADIKTYIDKLLSENKKEDFANPFTSPDIYNEVLSLVNKLAKKDQEAYTNALDIISAGTYSKQNEKVKPSTEENKPNKEQQQSNNKKPSTNSSNESAPYTGVNFKGLEPNSIALNIHTLRFLITIVLVTLITLFTKLDKVLSYEKKF